MLEYANKSVEEIASQFIVRTCQLLPKSHDDAPRPNDRILTYVSCRKPKIYAMHCGSSAEFYIRSVHSIVNDSDSLIWNASVLAFIDHIPGLPNDVSRLNDTISCLKIEPCKKYPGFVRLRCIGDLNYDWTCKEYVFSPEPFQNIYLKFDLHSISYTSASPRPTVKGPAVSRQIDPYDFKIDNVHSIWCPQWPKEAEEWLKRPRDFGWPTTITISEIKRQGCHVVYTQHRACRNDKYQCRLSFSIAEVILLRSWTPIQQLVYHLLRFFANRELIQTNCPKEDEVLCSYHLKTLML